MNTDMQNNGVYEGDKPYLFISYSHKDQQTMLSVKSVLDKHKIRYWYDNGLHSGDDWNLVIARHLKQAAVCLLLLSENSAESEYVKNELNFALNHGVPIHTLMIRQFVLPLDVEIMTSRKMMITMNERYDIELISALPPEIFADAPSFFYNTQSDYTHPLFEIDRKQITNRQGTKIHSAKHKKLKYPCTVLEDTLKSTELFGIETRMILAGNIENSVFPKIIDYVIDGCRLLVYQEYTEYRFLDEYLSAVVMSEDTVISWMVDFVQAIAILYKSNIAFRDFARGSVVVTSENRLKLLRAYHPYYGYVAVKEENRYYYFEKQLQEIAILLSELCTGKEPILPIGIIEDNRFSKKFLLKVNLIIQKCTKENGHAQYRNFEELINDLNKLKITREEKSFLKNRAKKLLEYEKIKSQRSNNFISNDRKIGEINENQNLEEEFGFEGTVVIQTDMPDSKSAIHILICSSGEVMHFNKKKIIVGKGMECDMLWKQPYLSRIHLGISQNEDNTYTVEDFNSKNGTFVLDSEQEDASWQQVNAGSPVVVRQGAKIKVGESVMQIL